MNRTYLALIFIAIIIALLAGIFASTHPDGLEKVAASLGFEHKEKGGSGVFIDYQLPAFPAGALSTIMAGLFGIILIIFIFKSISKVNYIGEVLKKLLNLR